MDKPKAKYYLFRDIEHEDNLLNDRTYHSAGYVKSVCCDINHPNQSGKDLAVVFFHPYECAIRYEWRSINEVELFEVDENEYKDTVKIYNQMQVVLELIYK